MLQPANPDILEGVDDLIKLSYLNEPAVLHDLTHRYAQDKIYVRANTSPIPASKIIWGYPCACAFQNGLVDMLTNIPIGCAD
jgi:hypothetical protein